MRKLLQIAGIVLLAGTWAVSASASTPIINTIVFVEDLLIVHCEGFDVRTKAKIRYTEKRWFDDDGIALKTKVHWKILESEYYNSVNPEISISQGLNGVGETVMGNIDEVTGETHASGLGFRLTIPRIGHVFMDIGTIRRDEDFNILFEHGLLWVFAKGETGLALCEALASTSP